MSAGWYADPTGRFPARYFDGTDWTDQAQGPDGQVTADAMQRSSSGFPAPAPAGAAAASPTWAAPAWGAPPASAAAGGGVSGSASGEMARGPGIVGLLIAGFGWLLALLSMFVLDWVDGGTRGDLTDALPSSLPDGAEFVDQLWFTYVSWAGVALFVLVAIGLVITFVTLGKGDPTAPRLLVGALAALAAVLHAETVVRGLRDQAEIGAQLGIAAYLLVVVGLAIGSRSRRPT